MSSGCIISVPSKGSSSSVRSSDIFGSGISKPGGKLPSSNPAAFNSCKPGRSVISFKPKWRKKASVAARTFDFSSSRRPEQQNSAGNRRHSHHQSQRPQKLQAFRSNRLFAVLTNCKLMSYSDKPEALRYLHKCREDCNRIIKVIISLHIHIKTDYLTN